MDVGDSTASSRLVQSVLDSLSPTDDPEMLGRIDDYEIIGVVGVRGMGAVLKGFDKSLRRVVAIQICRLIPEAATPASLESSGRMSRQGAGR